MENLLANHALLGNIEYPLVRSKLRVWLALEDLYADIIEAAEHGDREKFVSSMYSYVSAAFHVPIEQLELCFWNEVTRAFREAYNINRPALDFPMLRAKIHSLKQDATKNGWEYEGRMWYIWLHLLSKAYGWTIRYIENLSIDDGIALLQEILIDDQLAKEWEWGMSQNAYSYDEHTKTSKFNPLKRPDWMQEVPKEIKKVKIRASDLPVGMILKWDTDTNVYTKSQ